jgi:NAD+ synthase
MNISDQAKTNIAPRIRMTVLYAIAQSLGYLVIGTGNKSEAMIGWTTKFGDSACDFNPIGHLTCREVIEIGIELAEEFGLDINYIVKKPADGLTSKTDEDNFGFTYAELDDYLLYNKRGPNVEKIENMIRWAEHKRKMPPKVDS